MRPQTLQPCSDLDDTDLESEGEEEGDEREAGRRRGGGGDGSASDEDLPDLEPNDGPGGSSFRDFDTATEFGMDVSVCVCVCGAPAGAGPLPRPGEEGWSGLGGEAGRAERPGGALGHSWQGPAGSPAGAVCTAGLTPAAGVRYPLLVATPPLPSLKHTLSHTHTPPRVCLGSMTRMMRRGSGSRAWWPP